MTTRFRRAISTTQRCVSLILVMDQDQQRVVRRQSYIRHEALRSNLFSREILPTDEKLRAALSHLRNRLQIWIDRAKSRFLMRLMRNAVDRGTMEHHSKLRVR